MTPNDHSQITHHRRTPRGFTLIEILTVLGVLITLIAVLAPAISVSRPMGSALVQLKTTLQRARSEAIRNRTDTFVAFADSLPEMEWNATTDSYRYRAYAIFMRDNEARDPRDRYQTDVLTCAIKQVTNWSLLPENVLFALGDDIHSQGNSEPILTLIDASDPEDSLGFRGSAYRGFPLRIGGVESPSMLPCIVFNREGRVRLPSWNESHTLYLGLVGGSMRNGQRVIVEFIPKTSGTPEDSTQIPLVELLSISHATGHIREVGTAAGAGGESL